MSTTADTLAQLVNNTDQMLQTVTQVKETFEDSKNTAVEAAGTATTQAGVSTTQANLSATARAGSESARDSAINNAQAAAASAASISDYSARVQAQLHTLGITNIKAIAFKRAEGWERTGNQSYKTETRPTGRYLGRYANAADAWAQTDTTPASANEDWYYNSTDTFWYKLSGGNSHTRIYRAGSAHMPLEAAIVATDTGLLILDLTDPNMPLWMEFVRASSNSSRTFIQYAIPSKVAYKDGVLALTTSDSVNPASIHPDYVRGINIANFKEDSAITYKFRNGYGSAFAGRKVWRLANRNSPAFYADSSSDSPAPSIFNSSSSGHNFSGLSFSRSGKLLTAASSRLSVADVNALSAVSTSTGSFVCPVELNGRLYARDNSAVSFRDYGPLDNLQANFTNVSSYTTTGYPYLGALPDYAVAGDNFILGASGSRVEHIWPNPADYQSSLIARRGTTYATPPMKKPEVMLICSTVEGAVSDTDLITGDDSTFTTTVGSWLGANGGILSVDTGRLKVTNGTAGNGWGYLTKTTVAGVWYNLSCDVELGSGGANWRVFVGTSNGASNLFSEYGTTTRSVSGGFFGTGGTVYIQLQVGLNTISSFTFFDNVVLRQGVQDHSGLDTPATIHGTLTATAEVAGGVAGLSGYTAGNYLEAPNPWDGIGTGDGWLAFAFKSGAASANEFLIHISYHDGTEYRGAGVSIYLRGDVNGIINATFTSVDGFASSAQVQTASGYEDSLVHTAVIRKTSTGYLLSIDGVDVGSVAVGSHGNLVFNASAKMYLGTSGSLTGTAANQKLWFAGAGQTPLADEEVSLMHTHMRNLIMGKASLDEIPTSLAYDPIRKAVEMVGTTKRQTLQDGAITASVDHGQGSSAVVSVGPRSEIGVGGSTGIEVAVPERNLREYQARLTTERFTVTYAGNASRTLFPDPTVAAEMAVTIGAKPVRVSNAGSVQTVGAAEDYTVADYGLGRNVVKFAVAPGSGNDIVVEFEREVYA